jgi:hypothetical protein
MTNRDKDQMAALIEGGVVDDTQAPSDAPVLLGALSRSIDATRAERAKRQEDKR